MGNTVSKIIKTTYLNLRQNIKNLSGIYKSFYDIERHKNHSNSLIFLKRSVDKLLLIEKYISDINLDKDFETNTTDTDIKDIKLCLELRDSILEKTSQLKQQIQNTVNRKQAHIASQEKHILQNNLDCLTLAMKHLKYLDINMALSYQDTDNKAKSEDLKKKLINKNPNFKKIERDNYE